MVLVYAQVELSRGANEVLNPENWKKACWNITREMTKIAEEGCWLEAPVYGGERPGGSLVKSIHAVMNRGGLEGRIVSNVPYVLFVIYGTKPHKIEGNPALWLENYHIWVKSVNHPGMPPNDFPSRAVSRFLTDAVIERIVTNAINWLNNGGRLSLTISDRSRNVEMGLQVKSVLDYANKTDYIGYTLDRSGGRLNYE